MILKKYTILLLIFININLMAASDTETEESTQTQDSLSKRTACSSYTEEDRLTHMQEMAYGLSTIQEGLLYNNLDTVEKGSKILIENLYQVRETDSEKNETDLMERYMCQKYEMSRKRKKEIEKKARTLLERFSEGDTTQAVHAYTKITKLCVKCHRDVR